MWTASQIVKSRIHCCRTKPNIVPRLATEKGFYLPAANQNKHPGFYTIRPSPHAKPDVNV